MIDRFIISFFALVLSVSAYAADTKGIDGFLNYKFGMTEEDIRSLADIAEKRVDAESVRLITSDAVTVSGTKYEIEFVMYDDHLSWIILTNNTKITSFYCKDNFYATFAAVRARYGQPDEPPELTGLDDIIYTISATFTFEDTSSVLVAAIYSEDECDQRVLYKEAKAGHSF